MLNKLNNGTLISFLLLFQLCLCVVHSCSVDPTAWLLHLPLFGSDDFSLPFCWSYPVPKPYNNIFASSSKNLSWRAAFSYHNVLSFSTHILKPSMPNGFLSYETTVHVFYFLSLLPIIPWISLFIATITLLITSIIFAI